MKPWWLRLAGYTRHERSGFAVLVALMLTGIVLATLVPWPMKLIVDYVLTKKSMPESLAWLNTLPGAGSSNGLLIWLAVGTVVLFLAGRAVSLVQSHVQTGVATRMVYRLGADLFEHLQRLSLPAHSQQRAGDLVQRVMSDSACARDLVMGVFLPVATSIGSLATIFVVMWKLDRFLSVLALLAAVPLPVFMKLLTPEITERTYEMGNLQGELMSHAEQTLTALPIVQAFGREAHEDRRFLGLSTRIIRANLKVLSSQLKFKVAVGAPIAAGSAVIILVGGLHVQQGTLLVGSLLIFLAYLGTLYGPISSLANLSASFASAKASARRVLEILEADLGVTDAPGAVRLPAKPMGERGHVRLENVTFGYDSGTPVLRDVTLEARPGEIVALVGKTGAGKSTLVSLIPRFFDPWHGRVLVDGMDVRELTIASLRAEVAVVLQEPFLLPLSVSENIAYGRPEASREQVVAAAVAAKADEFIRALPQGYDTVIGERGATLSGGEKQRIAIARAILKDASILILDEPTSALDANTEALLLEALERLMTGRTTFIIAHRLSTIRKADRIVVIDQHRVVETGTHPELLASRGAYYRYYELQHRAAGRDVHNVSLDSMKTGA